MTTTAQDTLGEIANGIRSDLFKSYEVINLLQMINENATDINNSGFGIFFGKFQEILKEQIILLISKIFEKPDEFPLKSIPAMQKYITENKQAFIDIEMKDDTVLKLLERIGCKTVKQKDSVTEVFCMYSQNHIGEMRTARQKIETYRNKVLAHHERIDGSNLPDVFLTEIMELLERTKNFLAIVDSVYLGSVSVDYDGKYFLNSESKAASLFLRNLLVKANIIDVRKGREVVKTLHE